MRIRLFSLQLLASFVGKVTSYLLPELLFHSITFCPARRRRWHGYPRFLLPVLYLHFLGLSTLRGGRRKWITILGHDSLHSTVLYV
jgi:hypothetical protein